MKKNIKNHKVCLYSWGNEIKYTEKRNSIWFVYKEDRLFLKSFDNTYIQKRTRITYMSQTVI